MNYLIKENGNITHYFYKNTEGLVRRTKKLARWQDNEVLLKNATDGFGLYTDNSSIHIVTQTTDAEIIYLTSSPNGFRRYILQKIPDDCKIIKIFLYPIRSRLNILYSLKRGEDILLMHCILSDNARPICVSRLKESEFFVISERVYYTRPDGSSGFCELSDESPQFFIRICQNSSVPYLYQGHIAYKSGGKIYFDNRELTKDDGAEGVIINEYNGKLFVVWQSNGFVRYMPSDSPSGRPHSVISPSTPAAFYHIWHLDECYSFYGTHSLSDLTLYVNPSPFDSMPEHSPELFLAKRMENMKREIAELKNKLAKYV